MEKDFCTILEEYAALADVLTDEILDLKCRPESMAKLDRASNLCDLLVDGLKKLAQASRT